MTRKAQTNRRRLLSPWVLVGCVFAVLLTMALVFPRATLFQQLVQGEKEERVDSVRVILLQTLIQKGVKGFALRREYIRQLGLTRNYAAAFEELDTLASKWSEESRDSLHLLQVEMGSMAYGSKTGDTAAAIRQMNAGAEGLMQGAKLRPLMLAASEIKDARHFELAARLFSKMAELDSLPNAWQRRAAEMHALSGDCRSAAKVLMSVYEKSKDESERKQLLLQALRALQACDRMEEALALAESRIRDWSGDTEVLLFAIPLARSANRPKVAERFAQMLVRPLAAAPEP